MEYAGFEGDIAAGEYGGGRVRIWDRGTYETEKWSDREVKVVLHGTRVDGRYVLFRTGGKNWMVHRMDPRPDGVRAAAGSRPADDGRPAGDAAAGRRAVGLRDEVGRCASRRLRRGRQGAGDVPQRHRHDRGLSRAARDGRVARLAAGRAGRRDRGLRRARAAELRAAAAAHARRERHADPASRRVDAGDLHGLRRAAPRRAADHWDCRTPSGAGCWSRCSCRAARGRHRRRGSAAAPWSWRRPASRGSRAWSPSGSTRPTIPGRRSEDWLKVKHLRTQEVVIGGWKPGAGRREGMVGSLLLGVQGAEGLEYAGKVGTGFSEQALADLGTTAARPGSAGVTVRSARVPRAGRPRGALGRARGRGRGALRRVDAGRAAAPPGMARAAAGQGPAGRRPGGCPGRLTPPQRGVLQRPVLSRWRSTASAASTVKGDPGLKSLPLLALCFTR